MGLSRRMFTKEFKLAAVQRLERGSSIGEVARALVIETVPPIPGVGGRTSAFAPGATVAGLP